MNSAELATKLKINEGFLSIKRVDRDDVLNYKEKGCTLKLIKRAFAGETVYLSEENVICLGAAAGFGLIDGIPDIPGGFGNFVSKGSGEGFPAGERVKYSAEIGEKMFLNQPQDVISHYNTVRIQQYTADADTVTALVNPDQLSTLVHLFCYRKINYDNVIAPMVSGCASIFRIPFGELKREEPRAVIGNIDVYSRPYFEADKFFFTVSAMSFAAMLNDAEESVISAPIWKGVESRL